MAHPSFNFIPSPVLLAWDLVTQRFPSRCPFVRRNDMHSATRSRGLGDVFAFHIKMLGRRSLHCANAMSLAPTLSDGRTALPLPGTHPIRCPFMEIARSYNCLYPSKPHIVSDRVAHARECNGDTSVL
jgi:hypothetical protein